MGSTWLKYIQNLINQRIAATLVARETDYLIESNHVTELVNENELNNIKGP